MVTPKLSEEQTIYRVEKFIPLRCPRRDCLNEFKRNKGGDGGYFLSTFWLHGSLEKTERILESIRCPELMTDLIVCARCGNVVMRVLIEERTYENRSDAEKACKEEGFVNLQEAQAFGNMRVQGVQRFISRGRPHVIGGDN